MARSLAATAVLGSSLNSAWLQGFWTTLASVFQTGGMTKTTDTGQVNTATVTWPAGASTPAGYEIRQFTDTLAATFPIVFKFEIGTGSATNIVSFWLTIGTGSDGAGNITGVFFPRTQILRPNENESVKNVIISCEPSIFSLNFGHRQAGFTNSFAFASMQLSFERTHDATGADTSDGLLIYYWGGGQIAITGCQRHFVYAKRGYGIAYDDQPGGSGGGTAIAPINQTTGMNVSDNKVAVFPAVFFDVGKVLHPMKAFVGVYVNDYLWEGVKTLHVAGADAEYIGSWGVAGSTAGNVLGRGNLPNGLGMMQRYVT